MTLAAVLLLTATIAAAQTIADPVIRVDVNLVQVDVTVKGADNRPVTDLKAGDFDIFQDGRKQVITNFAYIGNATPAGSAPQGGRGAIAAIVDDLGLSADSVPVIRTALHRFVDRHLETGDTLAIVLTSGGPGFYQQFSSDKRFLHAAIDRVHYNPFAELRLENPRVTFSRIAGSLPRSLSPIWGDEMARIRSLGRTLLTLRDYIRSLRDVPGRKALLVFSEDLPMYDKGAIEVADAAIRSGAVIYTVDPRGLATLELNAAERTSAAGRTYIGQSRVAQDGRIWGTLALQSDSTRRNEAQSGMRFLAQETGGVFFADRNDYDRAIDEFGADTRSYYLLGYHPDGKTFLPAGSRNEAPFHKLRVKVKRPFVLVRTRTGFMGVSEESPADRQARLAARAGTAREQIDRALTSLVVADGIRTRLTAGFVEDPAAGPQLVSALHIDGRDLDFTRNAKGEFECRLELVSVVTSSRGGKSAVNGRSHTVAFRESAYRKALKDGLVLDLRREAPVPGDYRVKVVVRDAGSERIGTAVQFLEVPDTAAGRLALSAVRLDGPGSDGVSAAAVRVFPVNTSLTLSFDVLNAAAAKESQPDLLVTTRLFHDGQLIQAGEPSTLGGQAGSGRLRWEKPATDGALQPGAYLLQVAVSDRHAKNRVAVQDLDFEVRPADR